MARYLFTQPETIVALLVAVAGYFAYNAEGTSFNRVVINFVHQSSFALLVGMNFWVTFIAGLTMYRILPRPWFATVQSALFPIYMKLCFLFSLVALGSFGFQMFDKYRNDFFGLVSAEAGLIIAVVMSFANLFVTPAIVAAIDERNAVEKKEGIGKGVGADNNPECTKLKETNAEYAAMCKRVGVLHGISASSNLLTLVGVVIHLCVISSHTVIV